jgi:hypothetical protein
VTGQLTALIGAGVIFALAGYHWPAAIIAAALVVITVLSGWLPE